MGGGGCCSRLSLWGSIEYRCRIARMRGLWKGACGQLLSFGLAVLRLGRVRGFLVLPDLLAGSGE